MDRVHLQNVDYLSHLWQEENIIATEKYIRLQKSNFKNYHRLQYALLRNWAKQRNNGLCCEASVILWDKENDTTWLYGPYHAHRHTRFQALALLDANTPSTSLCEISDIFLSTRDQEETVRSIPGESHLLAKTKRSDFRTQRVRFNSEVKQAVCLPSDLDWYCYWWHRLHDEKGSTSQHRLKILGYAFRVYKSGRRVLNVPSITLQTAHTPRHHSMPLKVPTMFSWIA